MNSCTLLTIVGTGIAGPGHVTVEAAAAVRRAEKVFYLVSDALTRAWLEGVRPDAEDLSNEYSVGRPRAESYSAMVDRLLAPLRNQVSVCAAFYGHPGVFAFPSHEAIRLARLQGFSARMLPGVSAEDCLFADLGIDPGSAGCQSFEATDFLVRRRRFDVCSGLVLWQAGAIGVEDFRTEQTWNREGLQVLAEVLLESYPPNHPIVIYEATTLPFPGPTVISTPLSRLPHSPVSALSTLWIEPLTNRAPDPDMIQRLGLSPRKSQNPDV